MKTVEEQHEAIKKQDEPEVKYSSSRYEWQLHELVYGMYSTYAGRILKPTGRWKIVERINSEPELYIEVSGKNPYDSNVLTWEHELKLTIDAKPIETIFGCRGTAL